MKNKIQTLAASVLMVLGLSVAFLAPAYATSGTTTTATTDKPYCIQIDPFKIGCPTTTVTITASTDGGNVTWYQHYAFFDVTLFNGTTGPATWCWTHPEVVTAGWNVTSSSPDTTHNCHGVASKP